MDFARKALKRVVLVSLVVSVIAGYVAWQVAVESAERESIDLTLEVSIDTIEYYELIAAPENTLSKVAKVVTEDLVVGWFDVVELYDAKGQELAGSVTERGESIEALLPVHYAPSYEEPSYESITTKSGEWVLRNFIPIYSGNVLWGYLEGVRVVPDWQKKDIRDYSFVVALLSVAVAWLCGLFIYPIIVFLNREHIRQTKDIQQGSLDMMFALGKAISLRDSDTGAHNYRVVWISVELAERLGLSTAQIKSLILGSYLHDIGKIAITDAIMLKPGRLTCDEMEIMKAHVKEGVEMVKGIDWLEAAIPVIACHHEKWDGTGYPVGLIGNQIPLVGRIFAVSDVFDALCSERPYKPAFDYKKAFSIIKEGAEYHFDPSVVSAFEDISEELYERLKDADEELCRALMLEKIKYYFF
ncbi:HD-GYP domain-containing protein [Marinomonas atlantica]|uniref:HD-GYP domain-containing protein n=1 Tax=Marinomonas atlantica TaxID=1806668 RepID=UPI00083422D4|nr:HD domain-containing phosphohydrolase [Marinomonas atlantica]